MMEITHYSDPGCPWAWSASPHLAVLHWRYGDQLTWRLVLIGLTEDASQYDARGYTPLNGALGYMRFRRLGMPLDTSPRARNVGTGLACRAVVATRLVDPAREIEAFRALQLARFTSPLLFDAEEDIRTALSWVDGLDADAVVAALHDEATEAAYQEDRARARSAAGGATEWQGKAANSDGAVRFTAPSLVFRAADGGMLEAGGFQSTEVYDVCIANLDRSLERRPPGEDVVEILQAFPYALSTREVAAVMAPSLTDPDDAAAEAELIRAAASGRVRREAIGQDAIWHAVGREPGRGGDAMRGAVHVA